MKILVICQHYYPENFRVTEICEELVRRGHQVTAVVGLPNYPSGIVPNEYKRFRRRRETINGVTVRRCFEIGRRNTKAGLAVNYVSYMTSACWRVLWMKKDFDVIYAFSTSPVLMSLPGAFLRCFYHRPLMIYIMDIWPACLAAMRVPESSLLYRFMTRVSRWVYAKADQLIYSSKLFQEYLHRVHHIDVADEDYLPQFADATFEEVPPSTPHEGLSLLFAGNIGQMQAVDTFLRAAARLRDEPIIWHIVGDGSSYEACVQMAKEMELIGTVIFHGRKPIEDMPGYYATADALLVSMRDDESVNYTLPGKVQGYMAAGKPILGAIAGETPFIVQQAQCGFCCAPEDDEAFAEMVRHFMALDDRQRLGQNARAYYEAHFTQKLHMDRLEQKLLALAASGKEGRR